MNDPTPLFLSPYLSAELDLTPVGLRGYAPGNISVLTSFPLLILPAVPAFVSSSSSESPKLTAFSCVVRGEELRGRLSEVNALAPGTAPNVRPCDANAARLGLVVGEEVGWDTSVGNGVSEESRNSTARPKNGSTMPNSPTVLSSSSSTGNCMACSRDVFSRSCWTVISALNLSRRDNGILYARTEVEVEAGMSSVK